MVTNTRFTDDALKYGVCAGLHLISWDYPRNGSLKYQIDKLGLHPLTALTTLNAREKQVLLECKIVLGAELCTDPNLLKSVGVTLEPISIVLEEGKHLCKKASEQDSINQ